MLRYISWLLSFIYPVYCLGCQKEGIWLCSYCQNNQINYNTHQICPISLKKSIKGKVLQAYKNKICLDSLIVLAPYNKNNLLQKLLKHLKYFFAFDIAFIFGNLLKTLLKKEKIKINEFTITSVPLYWKRQLWRGFNQSELIAKNLGKTTKLLKRIKNTKQQAKLKEKERYKNMKNSFQFISSTIPEQVLLIDDVASTGATLNECAKILKKAGVKTVVACVIARNIL